MKTVLVTGASSGIGLATAVAAGRAGYLPIGTVRRPDGDLALREAAEKAGVYVDVVSLELTDTDSVQACVRSVIALHGRLDAVVNNAGVAGTGATVELSTMESLRAAMEVNFFGVVALTRAAMPHLRTTGGRLVTVSSVRGVIGQPFHEGYSAAKFAVEGFMEALAPVAAQVGVTVSLIEPAAVLGTASRIDAIPVPDGPYADAYRHFVGTAGRPVGGTQLAAEVADVVVRALTADAPPLRIQTSDYARRYVARKLADIDGTAVTRSWHR